MRKGHRDRANDNNLLISSAKNIRLLRKGSRTLPTMYSIGIQPKIVFVLTLELLSLIPFPCIR